MENHATEGSASEEGAPETGVAAKAGVDTGEVYATGRDGDPERFTLGRR